ncbi:MAG: transglycosylase domain-containing protein [Bacteroidales bacterium]|nr:transglycosylase domain-containing protein [Bacteroidales bacterium]
MAKKIRHLFFKKGKFRFINLLIYAVTAVAVFFVFLFLLVYAGLFGRLGTVKELAGIQHYLASEIYSADNVLLGKYYIQNRTNVVYKNIPEFFINALVATEDARFYSHNGIDKRSLLRVAFKSILLQKEESGGGSTLSQQLAKNLFPRKKYLMFSMPINKFREMILAVRLEKAYNKQDILELYLNTVSFGENTYGIESATHQYFRKKPEKLKPEESALLVGMLKATYVYNPQVHPENALKRRNTVFSQMIKYGYLDKAKADSLKQIPLKLNYTKYTHNEGPAPYFREHLRLELVKWFKEHPKPDGTKYNIYTDGLKIYTTINADLQQYAEEAVQAHLKYLQKLFDQSWKNTEPWGKDESIILNQVRKSARYESLKKKGMSDEAIMNVMAKPVKTEIFTWNGKLEKTISPIDSVKHYFKFLHAGFLAMEAKTGFVRAWVGGIDYRHFQYDHATARRQPGSVFKPVVYAAALESGLKPCDYFANDSVVYTGYDNWTPRNADRAYGGFYSVKGALTHSVNTVSVSILMNTGFDKVKSLARKMGIEAPLPEVPSLALGTAEVSLLELMQAYSAFINKGQVVKPLYLRRVEDKFGNIIYEEKPQVSIETVISESNAAIMTSMLQNVVDHGTASGLRSVYGFNNEMAGKTGTTQQNTDGWYIGYTPDLIAGAWVGGDNPCIRFRSMAYGQGSHAAMPIWAMFMQKIYADPLYRFSKNSQFNIPEEIKNEINCADFKEQQYESFRELLEKKGENVIELIKRLFRKKDQDKEIEEGQDQ